MQDRAPTRRDLQQAARKPRSGHATSLRPPSVHGAFPPGGYLVTKQTYKDVAIRAEVWVSDDADSGIFARCQNPQQITDETCYEANLFDQRPGQEYSTGAIVKFATVAQPAPKAGGKWNTMDFTLQGDRLVVKLNGATTVDVRDAKLAAAGPIALQWGRGTVKFPQGASAAALSGVTGTTAAAESAAEAALELRFRAADMPPQNFLWLECSQQC